MNQNAWHKIDTSKPMTNFSSTLRILQCPIWSQSAFINNAVKIKSSTFFTYSAEYRIVMDSFVHHLEWNTGWPHWVLFLGCLWRWCFLTLASKMTGLSKIGGLPQYEWGPSSTHGLQRTKPEGRNSVPDHLSLNISPLLPSAESYTINSLFLIAIPLAFQTSRFMGLLDLLNYANQFFIMNCIYFSGESWPT